MVLVKEVLIFNWLNENHQCFQGSCRRRGKCFRFSERAIHLMHYTRMRNMSRNSSMQTFWKKERNEVWFAKWSLCFIKVSVSFSATLLKTYLTFRQHDDWRVFGGSVIGVTSPWYFCKCIMTHNARLTRITMPSSLENAGRDSGNKIHLVLFLCKEPTWKRNISCNTWECVAEWRPVYCVDKSGVHVFWCSCLYTKKN